MAGAIRRGSRGLKRYEDLRGYKVQKAEKEKADELPLCADGSLYSVKVQYEIYGVGPVKVSWVAPPLKGTNDPWMAIIGGSVGKVPVGKLIPIEDGK